MAGLTRLYAADVGRAAVEAFKAGNDLLLIPADLEASYKAMLKAVESGEIPAARLDESVLKLLKAKASLGLNKARPVDITKVSERVGKPQNVLLGQQVADQAVTLVRDNGKVLPLQSVGTPKGGLPYMTTEETRNRVVVIVFSDDVRMSSGRVFEQLPNLQCRERWARAPEERGHPGDVGSGHGGAGPGVVVHSHQGDDGELACAPQLLELPRGGGDRRKAVWLERAKGELGHHLRGLRVHEDDRARALGTYQRQLVEREIPLAGSDQHQQPILLGLVLDLQLLQPHGSIV